MAIFWQHVGDQNSKRDFPRTLGTPRLGLRQFTTQVVRTKLSDSGPIYNSENLRRLTELDGQSFQIWGLPSGAAQKFIKMKADDSLMLLDSNGFGGAFRFIGSIKLALKGEHRDLSNELWTDPKFPLIALLQGQLIDYPWPKFLDRLHFGSGFKPMGRTYRISQKAFSNAGIASDYDFVEYVTRNYPCDS